MAKRFCYITILFLLSFKAFSQNSPVFHDLNKATVALYKFEDDQIKPHGTGFLLYNYKDNDELIVTCNHLLQNKYIWVNIPITDEFFDLLSDSSRSEQIKHALKTYIKGEYFYKGKNFLQKIPLERGKTYFYNDSLDIGIIKWTLLFGKVVLGGDTITLCDKIVISDSRTLEVKNLETGTNLLSIGFPFGVGTTSGYFNTGLYADTVSNPVVRSGILSWKSDKSPDFLIDIFSYPGSSGSPIITEASASFSNRSYLIGMILGHLDAIPQCDNCNSGLSRCVSIKHILALRDSIKN